METPLPDPRQIIDSEHLKLLAIFHYVAGGLAAFFACLPVIHLIIGVALILAPHKFVAAQRPPPAFIGWFFVIFASCFILAGWTFAIFVFTAGRFIARRERYTFCFVVAAVECLFVPLGTVLGVFTIVVLNRPSVKELFSHPV
jgi:hypothetical protein